MGKRGKKERENEKKIRRLEIHDTGETKRKLEVERNTHGKGLEKKLAGRMRWQTYNWDADKKSEKYQRWEKKKEEKYK